MALLWDPEIEAYIESAGMTDEEFWTLLADAAEDPDHPNHDLGAAAFPEMPSLEELDLESLSDDEFMAWAEAVAADPNHADHQRVLEEAEAVDVQTTHDDAFVSSALQLQHELGRKLTGAELEKMSEHADRDPNYLPDAMESFEQAVGRNLDGSSASPRDRRERAVEVAEDTLREHGWEGDNPPVSMSAMT